MFTVFNYLADFICYGLLGLTPDTQLASGLHFFIEDTSKIFVLLFVLIYVIALLRASLNVERVRNFLEGKNRFLGYLLGALFGAITPFCSCSSIPLFLGFVSARIPIGVTMAFLLTSPLINEIAIVLLGSLLGLEFTLMYIALGLAIGIIGGFVIDQCKGERWLIEPLAKKYLETESIQTVHTNTSEKMSLKARHQFALEEMLTILKRIWKWVIIGVGVGAFIHGWIPAQWFETYLAAGQWWTVPIATLVAIPMYTNATAIIPIMGSLLAKGLPLGTTLAFCLSSVAVSLPEFTMLKQVMTYRLLGLIFIYLLIAISAIGWIFNLFNFMG